MIRAKIKTEFGSAPKCHESATLARSKNTVSAMIGGQNDAAPAVPVPAPVVESTIEIITYDYLG